MRSTGNWTDDLGNAILTMIYLCFGLLALVPILIGIIIYLSVK